MRIRISHQTTYRYEPPASGAIQSLRLTPRNHDGQYVLRWRIDVSPDALLTTREDAFGNITHVFSAEGPLSEIDLNVEGEIETQNTNGIVNGAAERFPPSLFLRETPMTQADAAIIEFAREIHDSEADQPLDLLHALLRQLHDAMTFDVAMTNAPPNAAEAFALKRGVCRDFTHIFIAAARSLGIPARYVVGYLRRADDVVTQDAGHAWAEAFVPDLGWVGFDAANGISPTDAHVRVSIGLDSLGAAPVRGARYGLGAETMSVAVAVDQ